MRNTHLWSCGQWNIVFFPWGNFKNRWNPTDKFCLEISKYKQRHLWCCHLNVLRCAATSTAMFLAPNFLTPNHKSSCAGFSSRRPGCRADFGRGPNSHPGATRKLLQTHPSPQKVQKSSQRDSPQRKALGSSKARRLSFSSLQVNLSDDCHHLLIDFLLAASEAVTPASWEAVTPSRRYVIDITWIYVFKTEQKLQNAIPSMYHIDTYWVQVYLY